MKILTRLFVFALLASAFGLEIKAQKSGGDLGSMFTGAEGNWELQFQSGSAAGRAQISIWPKKFTDGVKSEWQVTCRYFGGPSDGEAHLKVDAVSASGVTLKRYDWYYHQEDADYDMITLSLDSPDSMSGVWINNEDKRGGVIARRVYPEITRVEFYPSMPTRASWMRYESPEHHISDLPGEMPVAEFTYKASGWGTQNNARGNRPQILVKFYGKNMWGVWRSRIEENTENFEFQTPGNYVDTYLYRIYSEGEGPRSLIGRNLEVHLWGEPKPGRLTFNINGMAIPFDFVVHDYPMPPLEDGYLVGRDGKRLHRLREGTVFAVEAKFTEPNEIKNEFLTEVNNPHGAKLSVRVKRQDDRRIFRSAYYQLLDLESLPLEGAISEETATSIAEHLSGNWRVQNLTKQGPAYVGGQVTLAADGKSGTMVLNEMDHAGRYVLVSAQSEPRAEGGLPGEWGFYFRTESVSPDASVTPMYQLHENANLHLEILQKQIDVPIDWDPANTVQFILPSVERSWMGGEWRAEQVIAQHGQDGASWWTRGVPRIREVIVLEDQTSPEGAFAYPGGERTGTSATNLRRLLILGENLPARQGTQAQDGTVPVSQDTHLRYGDFAVDEQTRELLMRRIFDETGRERPNDPDQLFVRAEFDPEVKAGNKTLLLGSATGEWPLQFNNDNADLRFTRDRNFAKSDEVAVFFPDDTAFVTLDLDFDSHLTDSRKVELALIGIGPERKMKLLGRVAAMRVEDETKPTFRSRGITWVKPTAEVSSLTEQGGGFLVPVPEGWRVAVRAVDPAITADPAVVTVQVPDAEVGQLWLKTLERVAAVPGVKGDIKKPKEFAMERGVVFSKGIYASRLISWDWGNNDVQLLNGSHAAALLIRDEFVRQMRQLLPKYIAQAKDSRAIRAFYEKALSNPQAASRDSFWKNNEITHTRFPFGLPLAEVLDLDYLAKERLGVSRIEAMDWALKEVASALEKQVDNMGAAIVRAEAARDANLDEIMVFAGYQAPAVIQEITSKLVVKKEGRWVPDDQAIRFVKGLYVPGKAIRSLEAYSDIDNAYNAMAVAVVTFGSSAALSAGGYATAAAYTSFIGNALDAAVVGGSGVKDYVVGERNFDTAMGAAPLLGNEIVDEAEAMRKSLLGAAAGVLLPSLGAAGDLAGLGQAGRISRGKALAEGPTGRNLNLDSLDDAGKADLLAYYDDLLKRRYGLGRSEGTVNPLSPEEAATYENLKSQFARKATTERLAKMTPEERQAYHDKRATAETSEKFRGGDHLEDGGDEVLPGRITERPVGELSRNYTDEQLRQLDKAKRNLTREEIMVKADAYRAGRLGSKAGDNGPTVRLPADDSPTVGLPSTETPTVGLPGTESPTLRMTPDETPTVRLPSPDSPTVRTPADETATVVLPSPEAPTVRNPASETPTVGLSPDDTPTVILSPREMPTMITPSEGAPTVGLPSTETPTVGLSPEEMPMMKTPPRDPPVAARDSDNTVMNKNEDNRRTKLLSPRDMPTMRTSGENVTTGRLPADDTPTVLLSPREMPTMRTSGDGGSTVIGGETIAPPVRDEGGPSIPTDEGATLAPPARPDPMDAPTGAFGVNPGNPAALKRSSPVDPAVLLREEMRRTSDAAYAPHQGRQVVDDMKEAEHQFFRQREVDDLEARLENYRFDSQHPRNSPEYEAGLEEVRRQWRDDLERMDRNFKRRQQELLRDHEVMDEVESFLGSRTQNDYFTLELERRRPDRALTKEEAVLGTLFNRHSRSDFPHLQGTPEQHRAALEASGLNREQARGLLKHWIDPLDKTDPASVDRAVTRYLDWTGF